MDGYAAFIASKRVVAQATGLTDLPALHRTVALPAYEPPRPRERETMPLRPLLIGAALGVPMWFGLYAVAAWARGVVSGWGR